MKRVNQHVPPVVVQLLAPKKTSGFAFLKGDKEKTMTHFSTLKRMHVAVRKVADKR